MSRNTDANKKIHNKKIANKKRKIQEAELKRKNRFREMRQNTIDKLSSEQENQDQAS